MHLYMSCTRLHALVYELYQATCTCIWVVPDYMHLYMSCTRLHARVYELYQATCTCIWDVPDYMHLYMSCTRLHALVYELYQTTCTCIWDVPDYMHLYMSCTRLHALLYMRCTRLHALVYMRCTRLHALVFPCFPMNINIYRDSFFSYIFQNNPKWSLPFPHFKQQALLSLSLCVELTWFSHKKGWTSTHHHNTLLWLGI